MKQYGVVVIGCGHIGQQHLQDIYFRDSIRLIGVVDVNEDLANFCKKKFAAQSAGTDYRPYLHRSDVDIFLIATYTDSHITIMKDALAAGKHVLCEKPVGTDISQMQLFLELVENSSCKVQIGHILRYNATYQAAANLIHSGLIGKVKVMRMVQNHHSLNWPRYQRLLQDTSPVIDCGVHYFDVMQWFTQSKIVGVNAVGTKIDRDLPEETINYGITTVQLADGSIGYYEAGWSPSINSSNIKEIVGEKGTLQIILNPYRSANIEEGDLIRVHLRENDEFRSINVNAEYRNMWGQLHHLIQMIEKDIPPCPTHTEVCEAFQVAYKAQCQMQKNFFSPVSSVNPP